MYRTIDASFWTDPKVRKLPPLGRLLFLYLITNPHTHVSGIYYLPRSTMLHETGMTEKQLDTLSDTLSSVGFCRFDPETETVWVKNMMRYQGTGEKNARSAMLHVTKDLHRSGLVAEFLNAYPDVKKLASDTLLDTLSGGYSVGATPNPIPHSPFPIPEHRTQNTYTSPPAVDASAFENLWNEYPSKDGKKLAVRSFNASVKSDEDVKRCAIALANYKNHLVLHPQKQIKNGSTWFNNWQDWEKWIEPSNGNGTHPETSEAEREQSRKFWEEQGFKRQR